MRTLLLMVSTGCLLALTAGLTGADPGIVGGEPAFAVALPWVRDTSPMSEGDCGPERRGQWLVAGEYLLWFLREGRVPPLLTTSSFGSLGRLGQSDTQVIYGDGRLRTRHDDRFVGGRITLGWSACDQAWGLEGRAFFLERDSTHFKVVSDGTTLLARPFFNAANGSTASEIIAGPTADGLRDGGFVGYSRVELFGQEANGTLLLGQSDNLRCDLILGVRFLQMRDRLDLTAAGHLLPERAILYGLDDHFRAHTAFYGGQVGLKSQYTWNRWFIDLRGTAALGGDDVLVRAYGDRIYHTPRERIASLYGLAVQPSNTGSHSHAEVDFATEAAINVGYRLTSHVGLFAGYTFLYWNNPVRAGDQVDLLLNPNQAGPHPSIPFRSDHFWAQGFNVGLELGW